MSGRRVQHLVVRGKSFQVRLYVPVDLQSVLDRKELRWSVRTREPTVAKRRALIATLAFQKFCDKLRFMTDLSVDDAREIARAFYEKLTTSYQTPQPVHPAERDEFDLSQERIVDEFVGALEREIAVQIFSPGTIMTANAAAKEAGFAAPPEESEAHRAICQAVARAQMEYARFTLFRQSDLLSEYAPEDVLFRHQPIANRPESQGAQLQSIAIEVGLSLQEALETYVAAHSKGPRAWKPKTSEEKERTFKMVMALLGPDLPIKQITTKHVREMRDFIQGLKSKASLDENHPANMLAKVERDRLNTRTAAKYFGYVRAFLRWLVAEGYLEAEPGNTIKLGVPKVNNAKPVRSFTTDELNTIFESPLYTGFKSNAQRHLPGPMKRQDGLYWMFLLGLYTGMRESELLKIAKIDVRVHESVPYIDIRGDLGLKTASSVRQVPIHPDLLSFGLVTWLEGRPKQAVKRLFCEIKLGPEGHETSASSKRLNGYLKRIGVKTGRDLVFHSFRHTFMEASRNADIPYERAKQMVGHTDGSVSGGYGGGANIETLGKHIRKIDFGLLATVQSGLRANALN